MNMNIKDFQIAKLCNTGTSYCSGVEEEKTLKFSSLEDAVRYFTDLLVGFYNERTGTFERWERINKSDLQWTAHWQTLHYEENLRLITNAFFEGGAKEVSCTGGQPFKYELVITKLFEVKVKTYVHLTLSENVYTWHSDELIRQAFEKKFLYVKDKKK